MVEEWEIVISNEACTFISDGYIGEDACLHVGNESGQCKSEFCPLRKEKE